MGQITTRLMSRRPPIRVYPVDADEVGIGYNIQVAVDAKNKLIVEQAGTNQVVDLGF